MDTALQDIVKEITVPLTPERAFQLFTDEIADWWPLDSHSLSASDGKPAQSVEITLEIGGEITEIRADGSKGKWGSVVDWQPGKRFAMTWHVGRPEAEATLVEVSFDVVADGTRVTLVHSNWQALEGLVGDAAVAQHAGYSSGWNMVFEQRYGAICRKMMEMT